MTPNQQKFIEVFESLIKDAYGVVSWNSMKSLLQGEPYNMQPGTIGATISGLQNAKMYKKVGDKIYCTLNNEYILDTKSDESPNLDPIKDDMIEIEKITHYITFEMGHGCADCMYNKHPNGHKICLQCSSRCNWKWEHEDHIVERIPDPIYGDKPMYLKVKIKYKEKRRNAI